MKPVLSVIIPVYNVEKYLERCIESILIQTWKNYEIILIDDGSTDNSSKICDDYAEKYHHISVIHKKNGGLSEARNIGIQYAQGDYVFFLDSDDWVLPTMFENLKDIICTKKHDIIHFHLKFYNRESDVFEERQSGEEEYSGIEALNQMLRQENISSYSTDKIYRTSLFLKNNIFFPVGAYYEDLGTIYKLFIVSKSVYYIDKVFYCYFLGNENSITKSWSEKKFQDMFRFYSDIYSVSLQLDKIDEQLVKIYYNNGLVDLLLKIYENHSNSTIAKQVTEELNNNRVSFYLLKGRPNYYKYILFRLGLLRVIPLIKEKIKNKKIKK
ncbi:glycosyltransferase [Streptococcus infantarius]|uniref:glycosyltransferase n=1 Tax=Streptococcus infantarius TaxID=102684 RepID=UPI00336A7DCA